mmetsp:Transcript_73418/g.212474  ORF Transcript_73418/g.212474 Transcript_73418/m.212474 type:complete len:237 (-) Transcript_73418:884-1594(-)
MAFSTAVCAALASAMAATFFSFAAARSLVASAMAASSSAIAATRSSMSWVSLAMRAVCASFCAVSSSTASAFCSRVCLFVVSSVSHQPLCSVSAVASCMRFEMRSLIMRFTFSKGSAATLCEAVASTRLFHNFARPARKAAACSCAKAWRLAVPERSDNSAEPLAARRLGKCFSPEPFTVSLCMMSMAWPMAASSPARSSWRASKSVVFCAQSAFVSSRYFSSSARSASACAFSAS